MCPAATDAQPRDPVGLHSLDTARAQFARGAKLGIPIFLGYVPVGIAFGILARSLGFTVLQAATCSATALAGAGQFIALDAMRQGSSAIAVLAATTVVNLRYVLFGGTISPYLKRYGSLTQAVLAFSLTDETFAVNISDQREGKATAASMTGVGAIAWTGWVLGTLLGAVGAGFIGDPDRWGVTFAMPAMFTALFVALAEDRRHVVVGLIAAIVIVALPLLQELGVPIGSSWFIIVASTTAATIGAVAFR